jgi:hypothetical protein
MVLGNGQNTRLWEDTWLGNKPLLRSVSFFVSHCGSLKCYGCSCYECDPLKHTFRRALSEFNWDRWVHLVLPPMRGSDFAQRRRFPMGAHLVMNTFVS